MGNNLRTTVILLVVAVGLSVYAYHYEGEGDWVRPTDAVFDLAREDFVEIELIPGPAAENTQLGSDPTESILLRRERNPRTGIVGWQIVKPISFPAFSPRVEGIIRSITGMQRIKSVPPEEAEPFFGEQLRTRIRFKTGGSRSEEHSLEIGADHPLRELPLMCVRVDGEDAFHTVQKLRRNLNSSLDDLRSHALFPVPPERALRVEIVRHLEENEAERKLTIVRKKGDLEWRFEAPHRGTAGRSVMVDLIEMLNGWRIESFVTDDLKDPSDYGLDGPELSVSVTDSLGDVVYSYDIVKAQGEPAGEVYLRDPRQPFVYRAKSAPLRKLESPSEEIRSQFLLQLVAAQITGVRGSARLLPGPPRDFYLWRSKAPIQVAEESDEEFRWQVRDDRLQREYEADRDAVTALENALKGLAVRRYIDRPESIGFDARTASPVLELTIELDTGVRHEVRYYEPPQGSGLPSRHYLATRSGSDDLVLVENVIPDWLAPGGIHLRDRRLSLLEMEDILSLEVLTTRRTWEIGRPAREWTLSLASQGFLREGKKLDTFLVNRVVRSLTREHFRVEAFLPDQKDLSVLHLVPGKTPLEIRLEAGTGAPDRGFRTIRLGAFRDQSPGQEYYAKLDTVDMPVLLSHDRARELIDLVNHLEDITGN